MVGYNLGDIGENLAKNYLENKGYNVLDTKYRAKFGEIDIIAIYENYLVFVEVKTRKSLKYGRPVEAVLTKKMNTIRKLAELYVIKKKLYQYQPRFDIIGIVIGSESNEIDHIENAF